MRTKIAFAIAATFTLAATSAFAAGKSCDELKSEIAAKLDAKKVTGYSLEIVDAAKTGDGKVVGTCESGTKKIIYTKK